jgi:3-dehydroquinate synthase
MLPYHVFEAPVFTENADIHLSKLLQNDAFSSVFILVDKNTKRLCLPYFTSFFLNNLPVNIIEIGAGETKKTLKTCEDVIKMLSAYKADRNSLLINLGGGVVCDLGSFAASIYKRGISFINVPTSLMAMCDAAIGGKTGVNIGSLKNQAGLFSFPKGVFIFPHFLNTLPKEEKKSAYSEIAKHALIADPYLWKSLLKDDFNDISKLIASSVLIKTTIVKNDPFEINNRKTLNFGHTIGHALEMLSPKFDNHSWSHGKAVASGIICEAYISCKTLGLPMDALNDITQFFKRFFKFKEIPPSLYFDVYALMKHDKKNTKGTVKMVLLKDIGVALPDMPCSKSIMSESLKYLNNL